tara:strand:- start:176 stop:637 length:462 start_codon:yes stop_codon:yes gene_type:complete
MARVTVEDCIEKVENRFELVLLAAFRARALHNGEEATVPKDNDKAGVVALREIAEESISVSELNEDVIKSLQLYQDEDVEDEIEEVTIPNSQDSIEENTEESLVEQNELNELAKKEDQINTESTPNDIAKESVKSNDLDLSNDISDETVEKSV